MTTPMEQGHSSTRLRREHAARPHLTDTKETTS